MALSAVGEFIATALLDALSQTLFYFTGKLLVPIISLGHWRAASIKAGDANPKPRWAYPLPRAHDGGRIISPDGQALLGLAFWGAIAICALLRYV